LWNNPDSSTARRFIYGLNGDVNEPIPFGHEVVPGVDNPVYRGQKGVDAYNQILEDSNIDIRVDYFPIEEDGGDGTAKSHPEEGDADNTDRIVDGVTLPGLKNELMTGWIDRSQNPMSILTLGMLDDLGWPVDYSKAEPFSLTNNPHFKNTAIRLNCHCH